MFDHTVKGSPVEDCFNDHHFDNPQKNHQQTLI